VLDDANALDQAALRERVAALEAQLVAAKRESDAYRDERDRLREAYRHLQLELELQRRRLFVAKAERIDTAQLDLEFAATLAKLEEVAGRLAEDEAAPSDEPPPAGPKRRPTGRRTLRDLDLPEERIVVIDPLLDGLVGRMGAEETSQLVWRRGGMVRLVTVRIKYQPAGMPTAADRDPTIKIAPLPPQILPRAIAGVSLLAHIASEKFCDGLPLYRQEDRFKRLGAPIDRGTMSRWLEELGAIMAAHRARDAHRRARTRSAATDATGVSSSRRTRAMGAACRRAHFYQLPTPTLLRVHGQGTSGGRRRTFRFAGCAGDAKIYDICSATARARPDDEVDRAVRLESAAGRVAPVLRRRSRGVGRKARAHPRISSLDRSGGAARLRRSRSRPLAPVDAFAWVDAEFDSEGSVGSSGPRWATPTGSTARWSSSSTTAG
jgi:transposase